MLASILAIEAEAAADALRERDEALRLLRCYVEAQSRMRDRWAEGDDAIKRELWRALHACEDPARAFLRRFEGEPG